MALRTGDDIKLGGVQWQRSLKLLLSDARDVSFIRWPKMPDNYLCLSRTYTWAIQLYVNLVVCRIFKFSVSPVPFCYP